ncbi:hypothetical protein SAMN04489859_102014 [Paracoccus alcaliphilus]|uniref:N-acetyltransferase domain-containing protein n=1 Tax=Paracoccus alcaliphilus TaxID=34002 RepID=A0A1H8K2Q6_9RHOB|nr:hypothetical protein [Paracoccus alcaliphilus]WCR17511.1 hypothetical protein JHW40_14405 [Paracoccus alcaliphilus]SEN87115.1 hypothetical protein SAMN04489859_102014 [Paracoccus alcaliphilus]
MTTTFTTTRQKDTLAKAMDLTNSPGFMEDACAIAAYQDGFENNPDYLKGIIVFEAFRPNQSAEFHFGMAFGKMLSVDIIQMGVTVAFHPKLFNLDRLVTKTPVENVRAICALLKIGFQIQHRERGALANGGDVIVSTLDRADVLSQVQKTEIVQTE